MSEVAEYSRDERKLRKALGLLIASVRLTAMQIDNAYADREQSDMDRGKKIAGYLNDLIMTNDRALYFDLGFDYRNDAIEKRKDGTNVRAILKWASRTTKAGRQ